MIYMEIHNGTHCVYIHTNNINGKMYIGQTVHGNNPNKRWKYGDGYRTQKYFYRAIKKYGWNNFNHEVVASNLTKEEADNFEILLIKQLQTYDKQYGYNIVMGGPGNLGYHISEETKQKRNKTMEKYFSNPEYIQNMRDVAPKRTIYQFTIEGDFIRSYPSAMEIERQLGILNATVSKCAFGKIPSVSGYIFLFEEDIGNIMLRVERYRRSKKPRNEPIVQLNLDSVFIKEWPTAAAAGRELGINYKNINLVCRGKRHKAGEYKWMYLSDYEQLNDN